MKTKELFSVVTDLEEGKTHLFRVRALNEKGAGEPAEIYQGVNLKDDVSVCLVVLEI